MSRQIEVTCDVCERKKGTRHGWRGYSRTALRGGRLSLYEWNEQDARFDGSICGEECAHKLLSRYLSGEGVGL